MKIKNVITKSIFKSLTTFLIAFVLYLTPLLVNISGKVASLLTTSAEIFLVLSFGVIFYGLMNIPIGLLQKYVSKTPSKIDDMLIPIVSRILRGLVMVLILLQILHILSGQPITTLLAGLGIGGLVTGLALQDSLKNFFGAFVIFIDKPFEIGDTIVVDNWIGSVLEVGLRSTRILDSDGNIVTIPNSLFTNKIIQNNK